MLPTTHTTNTILYNIVYINCTKFNSNMYNVLINTY